MGDQIQTLKGFRDFVGSQARKRKWLIKKIETVFERFGYEPLETPALEYESLLLGKYGTEADKLIYGFEDRGGRRVALRYDQTIPTARVISEYQNQLALPYKRYQMQQVWRADKPQKGRYREFLQCDADIIGTTAISAEAEILTLYAAIYTEIGLDSLKIKVNDREDLIKTLETTGIPLDKIFTVIQTIDKLDKKSKDEVRDELGQKGIESEVAKSLLSTLESQKVSEKLQKIISLAESMGVKKEIFTFSPTLARGLDYYTGMIFEGFIPEYKGGSVGGGGRYDKLLKQLVEVELPAVGFGLGFDRTLEAAEQLDKVPSLVTTALVLVTVFSPELTDKSIEVANYLRYNKVPTEIYLDSEKKLDRQLKYANKKDIPFVIIIGPEEVGKNIVKLKDMRSGDQKSIELSECISSILSR